MIQRMNHTMSSEDVYKLHTQYLLFLTNHVLVNTSHNFRFGAIVFKSMVTPVKFLLSSVNAAMYSSPIVTPHLLYLMK